MWIIIFILTRTTFIATWPNTFPMELRISWSHIEVENNRKILASLLQALDVRANHDHGNLSIVTSQPFEAIVPWTDKCHINAVNCTSKWYIYHFKHHFGQNWIWANSASWQKFKFLERTFQNKLTNYTWGKLCRGLMQFQILTCKNDDIPPTAEFTQPLIANIEWNCWICQDRYMDFS